MFSSVDAERPDSTSQSAGAGGEDWRRRIMAGEPFRRTDARKDAPVSESGSPTDAEPDDWKDRLTFRARVRRRSARRSTAVETRGED
jgi:hypothetical protein